jgi:hypothetical protein
MYYHASFHDPKLSGTNAAPTSEVRVSALLLLVIVGY